MNTAILSSVIGGSAVLIAALLSVLFNRVFEGQKQTNSQLAILTGTVSHLEGRFDGLEGRFDGLEGRFDGLEGRFDGLENRFDAQGKRIDGILHVLREHGERLARIEAKLDNDPPAEAA
ncbi:MAG: hypothetical protein KTV68_02780 [Acidimicrobiia bacterium]|nr:hypothetical protein [Acidimicrobiia bacterium]